MTDVFECQNYTFDLTSGTLDLHYGYPQRGLTFHERIVVPVAVVPLSPAQEYVAQRAARLVFLLAGVSYAKAFMPARLRCTAFPLSDSLRVFLDEVYQQGLAECAFRNGVDLHDRLVWQTESVGQERDGDGEKQHSPAHAISALVPLGGGKDSFVTWDHLSRTHIPAHGFILVAADAPLPVPLARTVEALGESQVWVARRKLCPNLARLNCQDGVFNGHVPITAIVSAVATLVAVLHGHTHVVFSNEQSASEATRTTPEAGAVNHQYSKSYAFEKAFSRVVLQNVTPDVRVFSLLRPWTELAIARRFASLTQWHSVFCSCNATFRHTPEARARTWCGVCPKCRFVFLALAPFLSPEALSAIFGADLLNDDTQTSGFLALLDLAEDKPFECVGTALESRLSAWHLSRHPLWSEHLVVRALVHHLGKPPADLEARWNALFVANPEHGVDEAFLKARASASTH